MWCVWLVLVLYWDGSCPSSFRGVQTESRSEDEELEMGEERKESGGLHVVFIGLCGSGT